MTDHSPRRIVSVLCLITAVAVACTVATRHALATQEKSDAGDTETKKAGGEASSQEKSKAASDEGSQRGKAQKPAKDILPIEKGWTKVAKDFPIWINVAQKEVIVRGHIALQRGALEMFACPKGTKEHESVVAVEAPARFVHLALLAVGARPGNPVAFEPEYRPASGTKVDIEIVWRDGADKLQRARAQDWVKNAKTGKALAYDWVFGGSSFWTDEMTGERYYAADGGELVCVSNFSNATLDLPVESTAANQGLLYVANDEKIPPRGTPVLMVLRPRTKEKKPDDKNGRSKPDDGAKNKDGESKH